MHFLCSLEKHLQLHRVESLWYGCARSYTTRVEQGGGAPCGLIYAAISLSGIWEVYLWTVSVLLLPGRPNISLLYDDCLYSICRGGFRFRLSDPLCCACALGPKIKGEGKKRDGGRGEKGEPREKQKNNPQVQHEELFCFGCSRSVVISGLWDLMDSSLGNLLIGESFLLGSLVWNIFTTSVMPEEGKGDIWMGAAGEFVPWIFNWESLVTSPLMPA